MKVLFILLLLVIKPDHIIIITIDIIDFILQLLMKPPYNLYNMSLTLKLKLDLVIRLKPLLFSIKDKYLLEFDIINNLKSS